MRTNVKISKHAKIGKNVSIGAFSVVHGNVSIGDDTTIEPHCVIGNIVANDPTPLTIGARSLIRSHSVIYGASTLGPNLTTGTHAVIRERSRIGRNVQIGSFTELQGDCSIGDYTRMQSSVFVPKGSSIGRFVWLLPRVVLTNDPHPPSDIQLGCTLEDFVVVCANAVLLPGVRIGHGAVVGAHSVVTRDVERGMLVIGAPARSRGTVDAVQHRDGSGHAYPWTRHFSRGYPAKALTEWPRDDDGPGATQPRTRRRAGRRAR